MGAIQYQRQRRDLGLFEVHPILAASQSKRNHPTQTMIF